jgi:hypothetical protein
MVKYYFEKRKFCKNPKYRIIKSLIDFAQFNTIIHLLNLNAKSIGDFG